MVFEFWWQGLLFGAINLAALSVLIYALSFMWKKYENAK